MAQSITDIVPHSANFTAGAGSANLTIGAWTVVLSPTTPPFAGYWTLSGTDAALFRVDQLTGTVTVGPADVAVGTYHVRLTAAFGSPPGTTPVPTAIVLTPPATTVESNAVAGTLLAVINITMSDGSAFAGTVTSSDTSGFFQISGLNIFLGRDLTAADVGTHDTTITASQGGTSMSASMTL